MILGPVVTCIYCCIYPPSRGSKYSYATVDAASLTKKKKPINFRNSVQAPFSLVADPTGKKTITVLLDFFSDEVVLLIILIVFPSTSAGSATYFVSRALLHLICSLVLLISNTLPFWLLLCSEPMFAEALGCHSRGVKSPQVKTTAQKFGAQHPFYLKELLASL